MDRKAKKRLKRATKKVHKAFVDLDQNPDLQEAERALHAIAAEHGIPPDETHRHVYSLLISRLLLSGVAKEGVIAWTRAIAEVLEATIIANLELQAEEQAPPEADNDLDERQA